ncbi:MAG: retention module-containing protein, partial [Gammaproteobacteria bacterium]|nr:retention module-containing protein [Gammaproteobacteria bacterium]
METTRIDSAVKIVSLQGQAFIIGQDGTVEPVTIGQVLLPGTMLLTDSNTNIVYGEAPAAEPSSQSPIDETAMAEAEDIQAAILAGLDPTELFSATAAGNEAPVATTGDGSSGNAGFVVVDRVGNTVISQAGFDTRFASEAFASQLRVLPERDIAADENSIPIITVVIDPPPTPPGDGGSGGGATLAYVEESALPNGTNPDSDNECASGRFDIDTGNDVLAKFEIRLENGEWVDVTGGGQIVGDYGTLDVTLVDGVYQWTYKLDGATDHPDDMKTGAEDVLKENFEVRATDDDGDQASAGLSIDVRDDGPIARDDDYSVNESGLPCYNLMLVIDTSGSMQGSRLALAKAALINLINSYDTVASELIITIIPFAGQEY